MYRFFLKTYFLHVINQILIRTYIRKVRGEHRLRTQAYKGSVQPLSYHAQLIGIFSNISFEYRYFMHFSARDYTSIHNLMPPLLLSSI